MDLSSLELGRRGLPDSNDCKTCSRSHLVVATSQHSIRSERRDSRNKVAFRLVSLGVGVGLHAERFKEENQKGHGADCPARLRVSLYLYKCLCICKVLSGLIIHDSIHVNGTSRFPLFLQTSRYNNQNQ